MRSDLELNNLAIRLRREWGEDDYSPVDVFRLVSLEEKITLITMKMSADMSGMCVKTENDIIIAVNSAMSIGRQRFTLAHELYHAYYDESMMTYVCMQNMDGQKSDSEKEADKFASFFLMPYSALDIYLTRADAEDLRIETIVTAEQFYGISHRAMLFRLLSEERIDHKEYDRFKAKKIIPVAERMGLGSDLYRNSLSSKPYSCTGSYLRKIQEAYEKGLIGDGKREELLNDGFADSSQSYGDVMDD